MARAPELYPVIWVFDAAVPAMVPPVAKIFTPGRSAANADAAQNTMAAATRDFLKVIFLLRIKRIGRELRGLFDFKNLRRIFVGGKNADNQNAYGE